MKPSEARLAEHAGYAVTRLADPTTLRCLEIEARERAAFAGTSFSDESTEEGQGPIHWLETVQGGPALAAFANAPPVLESLERLTGRRYVHRGGPGHYTYYRLPHHFSGLHRDSATCELAVVTCVRDDPGPGGDLILFPSRTADTLAAIRATPEQGAVTLRLQAGESVVMFGTAIAHAVTPVAPGRTRIVAALCYRRQL